MGPFPCSQDAWVQEPRVEVRMAPSTILFFWPHRVACGILIPLPGVKPVPPALGARSLNHWTAREFPLFLSPFTIILNNPLEKCLLPVSPQP